MRSSQITIKDIARELGISPSTVSRALKDHPDISSETKKAVSELAKKLHYQPNAIALSLKRSKRFTIGIIIPQTVHYFFSSVISGVEDVAYDAGYNIMICQSNERYDRELSNANMLYSNRVDGLLVSLSKETTNFDHLKFIQDNHIPVVFFDRATDAFPADQVVIDDYRASYNATLHLIKRGHKELIHLAAPSNITIGSDRRSGFINALKDHGLHYSEKQIILADNFENGRDATIKYIKEEKRVDGIFAVNDLTALGAMNGIKSLGLSIPRDIGIVGFSNGQYSSMTDPALTTVDQNGYDMGKKATEILIKRIDAAGENFVPQKHIIGSELVIRNSTL